MTEISTLDDKFLKNMRKKFNTKEKDKISLKPETMKSILTGHVQQAGIPGKFHLVSSPDMPTVKPRKPGENQLQTGKGKLSIEPSRERFQDHRGL